MHGIIQLGAKAANVLTRCNPWPNVVHICNGMCLREHLSHMQGTWQALIFSICTDLMNYRLQGSADGLLQIRGFKLVYCQASLVSHVTSTRDFSSFL